MYLPTGINSFPYVFTLSPVTIREQHTWTLNYEVTARDSRLGLHYHRFPTKQLHSSPKVLLERIFGEIETIDPTTRQGAKNQVLQLEQKGLHLFEELFPEDLQEKLWQIYPSIETVQIISQDPWIPWELCKLQHRSEEGPFFCEAFAMTRWFPGRQCNSFFPMQDMAVAGRRTSELPETSPEVDEMLALASSSHRISEIGNEAGLRTAMTQGHFDAWHLVGHGTLAPDNPFVTLHVGDAVFAPKSISGAARNWGARHPIFFLSCSHAGKGKLSLTGIGGWAERLTRNGVGAFIGAQWVIGDEAARRFAAAFYGAFLGGMPLGAAVKQAREAIASEDRAIGLAYAVFGDPLARCLPKAPAWSTKRLI